MVGGVASAEDPEQPDDVDVDAARFDPLASERLRLRLGRAARAARIARIALALQRGTYGIDVGRLADRLLKTL
jgi:anti-sigma28 factor (negative regulator of flagellin synthesis)